MSKSYRNVKAVKQIDATTCWAASLEWWLKVVENRPKISQEDALQDYAQYWKSTTDGSITKHGITQLVYDPRWKMDVQFQLALNIQDSTIFEHLSRGPVYFGYYERKVGGNHVNVIYDSYEKKSGTRVRVMEPNGGKHKTRPLTYYTNNIGEIILASPKP